jgi:hypothetical protein
MKEPRLPYQWQTLYAAAMLESDAAQLRLRIAQADEAIHQRLRELPESSSNRSEQAELHSALKYLRRLHEGLTPR